MNDVVVVVFMDGCCTKILFLLFVLLLMIPNVQGGNSNNNNNIDHDHDVTALFEPCSTIEVLGPSSFPKPTDIHNDPNVTVIVEPTFGAHRRNVDVVMAYAEGYPVDTYRLFLETLQRTGFTGDVVLAIAEEELVLRGVVKYLQSFNKDDDDDDDEMHVIVYQQRLTCFDHALTTRVKRKQQRGGQLDAFQMCSLDNVYGWKDPQTGQVIRGVNDGRDGRVVQTLRYEWYWMWTLQYDPHVWILLLDIRDSIFQSNPFASLPRRSTTNHRTVQFGIDTGYLYLFGENHIAARIGQSKQNRNWITNGYGPTTIDALQDKPIICSGSTMGEQIAIETYLRAMVNEWDETDIRMAGSDQGFHNYLYYSSKLQNTPTIQAILVWEQGKGIVNNLSAMRIKPLTEWGIYNTTTQTIYQTGQPTVPSPVIHQYDRDKAFNQYVRSKGPLQK